MTLGDRIKRYEKVSHYTATSRTPVMIRVDGRAFHTFTKKCEKPFDKEFISAMVSAAKDVAEEMHGFKAGYIQSDEATFCLTDYDKLETQGWFDYDLSKIISITASLMSVRFNKYFPTDTTPIFDSRAFNIPHSDVVNAFLWRARDWQRNSLQMYCQSLFSHKQLQGKKQPDMHEMLHDIGKNWTTDLSLRERNGTFLIKNDEGIVERCDILPNYESISSTIEELFHYE